MTTTTEDKEDFSMCGFPIRNWHTLAINANNNVAADYDLTIMGTTDHFLSKSAFLKLFCIAHKSLEPCRRPSWLVGHACWWWNTWPITTTTLPTTTPITRRRKPNGLVLPLENAFLQTNFFTNERPPGRREYSRTGSFCDCNTSHGSIRVSNNIETKKGQPTTICSLFVCRICSLPQVCAVSQEQAFKRECC